MVYLIDFENVSGGGFNGIEHLSDHDKIIVFYSDARSSITLSTHRKLEESPAGREYIPVSTGGKNALDFQLTTWLGYLMAKQREETYCIVSNDTGFDHVIDFWRERGYKIQRSVDLSGIQMQHTKKRIQETIPEFKEEAGRILDTINRYKTKQGINNALVKKYGSDKAGLIYKAVKPLLGNKKGK